MAISFDAATDGGAVTATSLTYSHTITGTNPFLMVGVLGAVSATSLITGITYNGTALTFISGEQLYLADRFGEGWYLKAPSTGANNVVVSASSSSYISSVASSYTGVHQTTPIDNSLETHVDIGRTCDNTIVSVADNCWHLGMGFTGSGLPAAGTGTTNRKLDAATHMMAIDNNGVITPAGSNNIQITTTLGAGTGIIICGITIAPPATASSSYSRMSLLGVGR